MTTKLVNGLRGMLLPALVATVGCGPVDETAFELDGELNGEENVADTYMSFEEFEAQAYREPDTGLYIVDGDTPIDGIDALREFWEQHVRQGALAVLNLNGVDKVWDGVQRYELTYCIQKSQFGPTWRYNLVANAMRHAAAAWSRETNVQFTHLSQYDDSCGPSNTKVMFDVGPVYFTPYVARAFFPGYPRKNRNIKVDVYQLEPPAPWTLSGVMRHELGHVLGFRHEHTRPQAATCFEDNYWRGVTEYDPNSVMHYPQCNGTNTGNLELTELDKLGVRMIYGERNGGLENLALLKKTTQSTSDAMGWSWYAVDGNLDGTYANRSVTHTEAQVLPYWQVDLGSIKTVGEVILHNRTDCCSDRLSKVLVTSSTDGKNFTGPYYPGRVNGSQGVNVNRAARYVRVLLNQGVPQALSLAEVEVLEGKNLAKGQVATQSSTAVGGAPKRAIDGNTNGNYGAASVTHTANELSPWWQVELAAPVPVGEVVIYNRTDCCANRLNNFKVMSSIDGMTWNETVFPGAASAREKFALNTIAKFVKVELVDTGVERPLSLAEVQVFAPRNLALGKTATQSSVLYNGVANRAVDGNNDGMWGNNSTTHTAGELSPWWQVDLGATMPVSEVVLHNRVDCCQDRLSNVKVMVSKDGQSWTAWNHPGVIGARRAFGINADVRYVKVQLNDTGSPRALSLAEVEVIAQQRFPGGCPSDTVDVNGNATVCQPYQSCYELHQAKPSTPDGMHPIDPDGPGGNAPFDAYCDMTTDIGGVVGGWTLLFNHGTGFNKANPGTDGADCYNNSDCVNLAFSRVPIVAEMLIDADDVPIIGGSQGARTYVNGAQPPIPGKTLHYLFNNGANYNVELSDNLNLYNIFAAGYDCSTWGDYGDAICTANTQLVLTDSIVGCGSPPFVLGTSNSMNCAGWPGNTGGAISNHWPENYRIWVR